MALVLLVATCALAGCGRKAGLDLPPSAAKSTGAQQGQSEAGPSEPVAVQRDVFDSMSTSDRAPNAPRGEKKRIPLDAILD